MSLDVVRLSEQGKRDAIRILLRDKCLNPQATTVEEALDAAEKWVREIKPTLPKTDVACADDILVCLLLETFRPEFEPPACP